MSRTTRMPQTTRRPHALPIAAAALLVLSTSAGCAGSATVEAPKPGESGLTAFQWAVFTDASLFFVPQGDYLYAARKDAPGVLESLPPKVSATVLGDTEASTFPLSSLMSPFDIDSGRWVMQRRVAGQWEDQGPYLFDGDAFVLADGDARIHSYDFEAIRFRPRG